MIDAYQPSAAVLQALQQVSLVAVVGPSGSGKTTLIRQATKQDAELRPVVAETSRPPRPDEREGVDYFFRTKAQMLATAEQGDYVVIVEANNGDLYASHIDEYTRDGLAVMAIWAAAMPTFEQLPFRVLRTLFIVPPSFEIWQQRLGQHGFDAKLQAKRLAEARQSFTFALEHPGVKYVINDELSAATASFIDLAQGGSDAGRLAPHHIRALLRKLDSLV